MNADSDGLMPVVETSFASVMDAMEAMRDRDDRLIAAGNAAIELASAWERFWVAVRAVENAKRPTLSFTEQEADRNADQSRREASLLAAKRKVDALPADQRARLEGEFQRAEQEAATIMRHGTDRNAALGREQAHCSVCADLPHSPHGMRARPLPMRGNREPATYELSDDSRPCCHTTGPHHHPACTNNRTGTEQQ